MTLKEGPSYNSLAHLYAILTEPAFLELGKSIEKQRGKIPDEVLNSLHATVILSRMDELRLIIRGPIEPFILVEKPEEERTK